MEFNHSSNESLKEPLTTGTKLEEIQKGKWQYQSNPWTKSEPPQWESYSLEHNYLIEKAYYDQQKEVDLGDYIVSIKHMIQKKKGAQIQQRPIRRINWEGEIEEIYRSMRYFETELPKTMNQVFGSLMDFVGFFSRRNPDMLDFTRQFEEIEKSNDLNALHQMAIPAVIRCLEIELIPPILKELEDSSLSVVKRRLLLKIKESHEELILLFKKQFGSFEKFYGEVLRAYTMNTSLYQNLNKYLRNESWVEIDNVLPYAFCLCKAFFNLKLHTNSFKKNDVNKVDPGPIILYRGTALDEGSLCFYKNRKTAQEPFSWNCVTSTSKNRETAEEFMYKSAEIPNKKYPVMFLLEVPILEDNNESKYLQWIDIHEYSAIPKEDEVILAPGSVFEIVKICTDKDQKTKIHLKMQNNVQSLAHGGLIMQGALQSKMMTQKNVKIVYLEGEELLDALRCLIGNKLVEDVEFCMCKFDKRSLTALMETLSTLERAQELKFISCEYQDQEEITNGLLKQVKRCTISKVEISGSSGFDEILSIQNEDNTNWISLRELKVAFAGRENDSGDDGISDKVFQRFRHFDQLRSLTLDFFCYSVMINKANSCQVFDEMRHLTQLTSLTVSFKCFREMTDGGVHSLACHGLKHLVQLTSLTLNFYDCIRITDKGMKSLVSEGLVNLVQLTSLDLNFCQCREITDEGVSILAFQGLRNLTQLTSLTMNLLGCNPVTDVGVHSISQGLQNLTQLTSLTINLSCCERITGVGVHSISQGFQNLTELTSLTLDFRWSTMINEGLKSLAQGLHNLNKLTSLTLDFCGSEKIANKGVRSFAVQGLRHLTKLTILNLNFRFCDSLADREVGNLAFEGLRYLTKLTSLTLNFNSCKNITNKGMRSLASEGLRYLIQLTSLTLDFTECEGITDEEKDDFRDQILRYLSHLEWDFRNFDQLHFKSNANGDKTQTRPTLQRSERKQLTLRRILDKQKRLTSEKEFATSTFQNDTQVRPSSFESPQESEICLRKDFVAKQSLSLPLRVNSTLKMTNIWKHFSKLISLTLYCSYYKKIDEELSSLWLSDMTELKFLTLDLSDRKNITVEEVQSLATKGLQNLTQLTSLTIKFNWCYNLTDEGIRNLASQGFQYLTKLKSLALEFSVCNKLTDEGIQSLASKGFQYLTKLTSLTLSFSGCFRITDKGMQSLMTQWLQHLTQLTSLTLNFFRCEITNDGMQSLVSQGLKNLTQLRSLTLNLGDCKKITDKGVHILAFQGLKHMTQLSSLSLDFLRCDKITDFMFSNLSKVLHYLGFVEDSEIDEDYIWDF